MIKAQTFAMLLMLPLFAINATATAETPSSNPFNFSTNSYTNHAGHAIAGQPVMLTVKHVALAECSAITNIYPLSIFLESEQRRIAADFGEPRVPSAVKRAVAGAEKAMERSRKRAEKGLCSKEESDAFCAKSAAALKSYLDRQVESGAITPAERKALGQ